MVVALPTDTDIAVQSADGDLLAVVELKNLENLTPEFAAEFRTRMMERGPLIRWARYILIVSQEVGYLWDQRAGNGEADPLPSLAFPMSEVIQVYLPSLANGRRLARSSLSVAVTQWLWSLAVGNPIQPTSAEASLAGSDFLERIKGGRVNTELED